MASPSAAGFPVPLIRVRLDLRQLEARALQEETEVGGRVTPERLGGDVVLMPRPPHLLGHPAPLGVVPLAVADPAALRELLFVARRLREIPRREDVDQGAAIDRQPSTNTLEEATLVLVVPDAETVEVGDDVERPSRIHLVEVARDRSE